MRRQYRKRIIFAASSTGCGAVLLGVFGKPDRFPMHYVGFALFLAGTLALGVFLYGKVD